jgi:uncharacterized membrane protein YphA (DoxX/SURF4 family)
MFVPFMYEEYLIPIALITMRVWLGTTLFLQASDKLFKIGIHNVSKAVEFKISKIPLSSKFYLFFAGFTSCLEFAGGILLVLGLFKVLAFSMLCLNMLLVSAAFSLNSPMWDMRHFFPRFIVLILLMFVSSQNDWFSLDWYINKNY